MLRQGGSSFHRAVVEAGGIVILHRCEVIPIIFIDQKYLFQLIFITIQLVEDFCQVLRDRLVTD